MFRPPGAQPTIIEIDGSQHQRAQRVDADRDQALRSVGIRTIRVPSHEFDEEESPNLAEFQDRLDDFKTPKPTVPNPLVWAPVQTHRLVLALCEALDAALLAGSHWTIELCDPVGYAAQLVGPYLGILDAVDCLWNENRVMPERITFRHDSSGVSFSRIETGSYEASEHRSPDDSESDSVRVLLEYDRTPSEPLPAKDDRPTVVVRSCALPVRLLDSNKGSVPHAGLSSVSSAEDHQRALRAILRGVFAKKDFREGQLDAISQIMSRRDCVVLLPTGAGKSLIYQLAGLCLPGKTLIVDPIVSLMEDQVESLKGYGIDRAENITSMTAKSRRVAADAYFLFIQPERLRRQRFLDELTEGESTAPINLAVLDEAHCVSEWGHDFRPSYLNIGRRLRKYGSGSVGTPPLLALSGTVSRVVLNDLLQQLEIEDKHSNSIVRPRSFDREELTYRIVFATPRNRQSKLRAELKRFPQEFGVDEYDMYIPGEYTKPGIVFVQTVNGKNPITMTVKAVEAVAPLVTFYSGGPPRGHEPEWDSIKSEHARDFKDNRAPVMVATNAFGMGIDKPDIRWVVHFGLPGSIEAFYQEVGRAGRDKNKAISVLILTEKNRDYNERLLSAETLLERRSTEDDIDTALYFHEMNFGSIDEEHEALMKMLSRLHELQDHIPLGKSENERKANQKALHRLSTLGVVNDYTLEGFDKSTVAIVETADFSTSHVVAGIERFLKGNQPGRRFELKSADDYPSVETAVEECGMLLISSVRETIEKARRRSLRELWLAAGHGDGELLRNRILEYLTEGDVGNLLQDLADHAEFAFQPWIKAWLNQGGQDREVSVTDAVDPSDVPGIFLADGDLGATREWRSGAARLLGSFPDHPGLLASRGLGEALLPDGDAKELEGNLWQALARAADTYDASAEDIDHFVEWLLTLFGDDSADGAAHGALEQAALPPSDLAAGVVCAARHADAGSVLANRWLTDHWSCGRQLAMLRLADGLDLACEVATIVTDRVARSADG